MNGRREFLVSLALMPILTKFSIIRQNGKKILPKALKSGDKVGIIAPATAVSDPDDIAKAKEIIESLGLECEIANSVYLGQGYKTRSIDERIIDLHRFFLDNSIKAIFAIRGGYGSGELLDKIDYDIISNNPKIFAGFSDITALHIAINQLCGLITFHSPMMLARFNDYTFSNFKRALFNNKPIGVLSNPEIMQGARKLYPIRTIISGVAEGIITGGNLTIISSLMGTPFEIDTKNKILLLEDVGEEPYRIDRMLNQLRLAGKFRDLKGIIFGVCTNCDRKSDIWDLALGEVLDKYFKPLAIPSFSGFLFGHTDIQITIPIGADAIINSEKGTLEIIESILN